MPDYDGDIKLSVDLTPGDIKSTTRELQKEIENIFDNKAGQKVSDQFLKAQTQISKTYDQATKLIEKLEAIENTKIPTADYAEITKYLNDAQKQLDTLRPKMDNFVDAGGNRGSAAFRRMTFQAEQLEQMIAFAKDELQDLEQAGKAFTLGSDSAEYQQTAEQLNHVNDQLFIYTRNLDIIADSTPELQAEIEAHKQSIEQLEQELNTKQQLIENTQQLIESDKKLLASGQEKIEIDGKFVDIESDLAEKEQELQQLFNDVSGLQQEIDTKQQIIDNDQRLIEINKELANAESGASANTDEVARSTKSLANHAELANSRIKKVISSLAKMAGTAILTGLKKLGNNLKGIASHLLNINHHSKRGTSTLKKLILAGLGIRGLYSLVRKLRSAIVEAFDEIGRVSPEFNATLTEFKNSLAQLKNSFGSAFAPLAQYVMPLLTKFLNIISEAATRLGMFIATLTGAKTFTRAIAIQSDYNEQLEDTASAAKEAKKQLAGFDDVNILSNPSTGGNSTNTKAENPLLFEEVPIDSGLSDLANRIKSLFKNQDWEGLGTFIGEKINSAFTKIRDFISWDNLGDKITSTVNAITTTINSLVDTIDWDLIGDTFATGVNTIIKTLDLLITGVNWSNLGDAFGRLILGFVDNVDWDAFAKLIADGIEAVFDLTNGFIKRLNQGKLGEKLAYALNSIIKRVSEKDIGKTLGEIISGGFNLMMDFLTGINYEDILFGIYDFFADLFGRFDPKKLGKDISKLITKILSSLSGFLAKINISDAVKSIGEFIADLIRNIDVKAILAGILDLLVQIVLQLPSLLMSLVGSVLEIIASIIDSIFGDTFLGGKIAEGLQNLADQAYVNSDYLDEALSGVKNSVHESLSGVQQDFDDTASGVGTAMTNMSNSVQTGMVDIDNHVSSGFVSVDERFNDFRNSTPEIFSSTYGDVVQLTDENGNKMYLSYDKYLEMMGDDAEAKLAENETIFQTKFGKLVEVVDEAGNKTYITYDEWLIKTNLKADERNSKLVEIVETSFGKMVKVVDEKGNESLKSYDEVIEQFGKSGKDWVARHETASRKFIEISEDMGVSAEKTNSNTTKSYDDTQEGISDSLAKAVQSGDTFIEELSSGESEVHTVITETGEVFRGGGRDFEVVTEDAAEDANIVANEIKDAGKSIQSSASDTSRNVYTTFNKYNYVPIGQEIPNGLIVGINNTTPALIATANNIANQVYQTTRKALQVRSPSRLFEKGIGEMLPLGLAKGVENETDVALKAVREMSDSVYDEAALSNLTMPAVAMGAVVPYSVNIEATSIQSTLDDLTAAINDEDRITRDDLRAIITDVVRENMRIDFYMGDEQVARHAQAGSQKLDRRYNPVAAGA